MGSNTSKMNVEPVNGKPNGESISDPRSPTPEIVRTPLSNKTGQKHNITKNADLRKTFDGTNGEEKLIHNNPILSAVIKNHLQSYDPRSPTQDFERTPIVIASQTDEVTKTDKKVDTQNDEFGTPNLKRDAELDVADKKVQVPYMATKNLCNGFLEMTLDDTLKDNEAPLGSSTASADSIEKETSVESEEKPTQLLETNFDYVETSVDQCEEKTEQINTQQMFEKMHPHLKVLETDPRSPSIGIERTPIVVTKIEEEDSIDENVDDMSDDTLLKVLQSTNTEFRDLITKKEKNPNEELLIYEDETANINVTPKKSKSTSNSASRTPLSCVKNKGDAAHVRSKSANHVLNDPKDQKNNSAKSAKRASHIPRLKSLSRQCKLISDSSISLKSVGKVTGVTGDCENTPPHSHRDSWDKNNSIVL